MERFSKLLCQSEPKLLLDRIGGEPALNAAVDEFYVRVISDKNLTHFFDGITIEHLKEHQRKFIRMAFTKIPESIDVEKFMQDKHHRLFLMGLNETHFDLVAGHFHATLKHLNVEKDNIDEAIGVIAPLRSVFVQGSAIAQEQEEKKEEQDNRTLHERIGGDAALEAAVDDFYNRLITDESLTKFFAGVPLDQLKEHQRKFMRMAFTKIPESIDIEKFMLDKHTRLFRIGLNEEHFDAVAGHFVATLQSLAVNRNLIDEAVSVVIPLRPIFEKGAAYYLEHAGEEKKEEREDNYLLHKLGGDAALTAAVDEFYIRVVADPTLARFFVGIPLDALKEHQRKFMRMAFTEVPGDIDVEKYMFKKHYRLFYMGLNEEHFDTVATHFVETLRHLDVERSLIDEAVSVIAPLRPIFVKGGLKGKK